MSLARRAARAALAASFISGGIDQIRNPQPKAAPASPIAKPIADRIPQLPNDPESLVKLDGAIKVVGGLGLIVGPFARPAALLLAGTLVPTTLAGHRFWETNDPEQRVSDRVEFFKNVSLLGGLIMTALDTGGRPSIPWMASKTAHGAAEAVGDAAGSVGSGVSHATGSLTGTLTGAASAVSGAVATGAGKVGPRSSRKAAKGSKKADALKAALAAQAPKADAVKTVLAVQAAKAAKAASTATKDTARTARKQRADSAASARFARAKGAALAAGVAAKGAAVSAGLAAKDTALAAKEKVAATAAH